MKYSRQRRLILELIQHNPVHPTAEWLYEQARREIPGIGIATVYRNLNALVEMGMIRRIPGIDGIDHFDADLCNHYHLQCSCCGKLIDLHPTDKTAIDHLKETIRDTFDLGQEEITISTTLLRGICDLCKETEKNT